MAKLNARTVAMLSLCLGLLVFAGQPAAAKRPHGGKDGGKEAAKKPEDVRGTVERVVGQAIRDNRRVGAALIRLVFHDCWVNGCDGSVLLDGNQSEKKAKNNIGLAGFDVIDKIKSELYSPDNVSCADILVLAAREATFIVSGRKIDYKVTTGRMDGVVSLADQADKVLPHSTFDVAQLKQNFDDHKFTARELTTLTGAHTIGFSHSSSFQDRLNNTTPIDELYLKALSDDVNKKKTAGVPDPIEPLNIRDADESFRNASGYDATGVDTSATGVLDGSFYHANLQNRALLRSDWELRTDGETASAMDTFKANATTWFEEFGSAMKKLSELLPPKGSRLEIRKECSKINGGYY